MQNRYGLGGIARAAAIVVVALAITTPAAAQFGGFKKKLTGAGAQEGASKAAAAAGVTPEAPAEVADAGGPAAGGGTIVLTEDVVGKLIAGLKAGQATRAAAAKEDTPYGRYKKAGATYAEADRRCRAAQQTFPQRMSGNEKLMSKYSALVDKMVAAQGRGDQKLMAIYQDSAMAMQDPSCVVKQPTQPDDYYQAQRDIDSRAEQQEIKTSGYSQSELAMVKERAEAILREATPPGGASPGEKSAVAAKAGELKPLLGIQDAVRATKPAPAPAPAPASTAPALPAMPPAASGMNTCMMNNIQNHQAEIEALGKRAEAAKNANDTGTMMAIVDTLQQIQMAGCREQ
jgi:hypothetical protein